MDLLGYDFGTIGSLWSHRGATALRCPVPVVAAEPLARVPCSSTTSTNSGSYPGPAISTRRPRTPSFSMRVWPTVCKVKRPTGRDRTSPRIERPLAHRPRLTRKRREWNGSDETSTAHHQNGRQSAGHRNIRAGGNPDCPGSALDRPFRLAIRRDSRQAHSGLVTSLAPADVIAPCVRYPPPPPGLRRVRPCLRLPE